MKDISVILQRFGVGIAELLGSGGESWVYALDSNTVLRVFKDTSDQSRYLTNLDRLHEGCQRQVSYALPKVLEIDAFEGRYYSVEQRIPGRPLSLVLPGLSEDLRARALRAYLEAGEELAAVRMDSRPFGELVVSEPLTDESWHGFLQRSMSRSLEASGHHLASDVEDLPRVLSTIGDLLAYVDQRPDKTLVHGDFFPANVMVDDDLAVIAVIDFSPLTIVGDHLVDVAGALMWLEVVEGYRHRDSQVLREMIYERHGSGIDSVLEFYRAYYSLYFAGAKSDDPKLYAWCVDNLRRLRDLP